MSPVSPRDIATIAFGINFAGCPSRRADARIKQRETLMTHTLLSKTRFPVVAPILLSLSLTGGDLCAQTSDPGSALPAAVAESTADDLEGLIVENDDGTAMGTFSDVVRDVDGRLLGVVQTSDLGSTAQRSMVVSMADLERSNGRLRAPTDQSAAMLGAPFADEGYEPVPGDIPLAKLVNERLGELQAEVDPIRPFSQLDLDHDGVLSSSEAHASPQIGNDWQRLDINEDGVIDRSEFSIVLEEAPPTAREATR